ncbi:hypothetical protein DYI68_25935, partial [Salmonella enterica]|nr:hypothetical protein [Salmonella enterica]EDO3948053.1 hypothetical protein [Salmonella enterica subsp. enterica serovar Muenchen]EBK9946755.1 hypothetical protein [Salmonella enterica]ECS0291827.1 tail fiber assembly protein [Salmonella enterica]EEH8716839.1 tail fiber assembly protein [Salmonella enterica]
LWVINQPSQNFSQMSQDAIDPRIATDDEKAHLDEWKKYRVLVTRVDTLKPVWPKQPNSNL